jgi:hypothetical protein
MVAAFFAGILLTRLIIAELVEIFGKKPTVPSVDGEIDGDPNGKYYWLFSSDLLFATN